MTTLDIAVGRLVNHVAHWTPSRWSRSIEATGGGTRADAVHALVQRIADAAAEAEGQPRRPVPRLTNDLALPDQLRVVTADLLTAAANRPDLLATATAETQSTAATL